MKIPRVFWTSFALLAVGVGAMTLIYGQEYFGLPRMDRRHAPEHGMLGPGGSYGHILGIAGSCMMVANLLYLVRRRWARVDGFGELSSWLAFHVALGVGGVTLVFVHSAMLFDNLVARVSMIAAGIVLFTGVLGRWIYAQIPHRPDGHEAGESELVAELRAKMTGVKPELRSAAEDTEMALTRVAAPPVSGPVAGVLQALMTPVVLLRFATVKASWGRRLTEPPYALAPADVKDVLAVATATTLLRRKFRRQSAFKQVVGAWRGIHRIATFVLLLSLVTHVVIVLYFSVD